jgi:hypothetical protein
VPYITLPNEGLAGVPETDLPPDVRARDFAYLWDLMCNPGDDPTQRDLAYSASTQQYRIEYLRQRLGPGFRVPADMALLLARAPDATSYTGAGLDAVGQDTVLGPFARPKARG